MGQMTKRVPDPQGRKCKKCDSELEIEYQGVLIEESSRLQWVSPQPYCPTCKQQV